jgi:hypothetical protein
MAGTDPLSEAAKTRGFERALRGRDGGAGMSIAAEENEIKNVTVTFLPHFSPGNMREL